jgi:hypothetical protein
MRQRVKQFPVHPMRLRQLRLRTAGLPANALAVVNTVANRSCVLCGNKGKPAMNQLVARQPVAQRSDFGLLLLGSPMTGPH